MFFDPYSLGLDVKSWSHHEARCLCPFHADHTPSASFNASTGMFYCFGCQAAGSVFTIARRLGTDIEIRETLGDIIHIEYDDLSYMSLASSPLAYDHDYLEWRGVSNDLVKRFGIFRCDLGVGVPIKHVDGQPKGVHLRTIGSKSYPRYLTLGSRIGVWPLSNMIEAATSKRLLFIVEGMFGVFNAAAAGYLAVSTLGASASVGAVKQMASIKKAVICFDDDLPGYLGATRLMIAAQHKWPMLMKGIEADECGSDVFKSIEEDYEKSSRDLVTFRALEPLSHLKGEDADKFKEKIRNFIDHMERIKER